MIIVSQDKMEIINLDRVTEISVSGNCICVTDRIEQEAGYIVAEYKTEERAKEVLKEIIQTNTNFEYYKCADESERNELNPFMKTKYQYFDTYEMPED